MSNAQNQYMLIKYIILFKYLIFILFQHISTQIKSNLLFNPYLITGRIMFFQFKKFEYDSIPYAFFNIKTSIVNSIVYVYI